jgi:4-carboxymuconolactone decarboxylase
MNDQTAARGAPGRPIELRLDPAPAKKELDEILAKTLLEDGEPLMIFQILAHNPRLLRRFNSLGGLFRISEITDLRSREVIILRMAVLADCPFEFDQHQHVAAEAGMSEPVIRALRYGETDVLDESDRLLVQLTDDIYDFDCVQDATWDSLAQRWTPPELLELVVTAAFFRLAAVVVNSIGIRPDWPSR